MESVGELFDRFTVLMSMEFWLETALALGVMLFVWLIHKFVASHLLSFLRKLAKRTRTKWDNRILAAAELPLPRLFKLLGVYLFLVIFPLSRAYTGLWNTVLRSYLIIAVAQVISYLVDDVTSLLFSTLDSEDAQAARDTVVPILGKAMRAVVYALAVLMVIQEWGFDIKGFIAGLGLAGFAVAMGAQDTITNFLSGMFLVTDRTLQLGDWVATDQVEGVIEEMSFRTTKIRTFEKSLITVPNSILANTPVYNNNRRDLRRILFNLGVTYDTTKDQLKEVIADIKALLLEHGQVQDDTIYVRFMAFNDSSLDIMVYCFTTANDYADYVAVREEINMAILDILDARGVSAAFPSTSVYMENVETPAPLSLNS